VRPLIVLLSGGADSVCLLDRMVAEGRAVHALHVDFGLRAGSGEDASFCEVLCERLGVPLTVHRPASPPAGNVQAWARDERYRVAFALAERHGADVATGHTATDQVETVLYRLAASPGRRALLGMPERDGRLVRPLLGMTHEETVAHCRARGLPWREDPSNASPRYARNRVRHGLVPALRALHPAAEANVLRTVDVLRDEAAVLDAVVEDALTDDAAALAALPPALRRLVFQRLAGGAPVGARVDEVLALAVRGGTRSLDLGGGLRAVAEYGRVRVEPPPPASVPDAPVTLPVPGRVPWGGGELVAEPGGPLDPGAAPLEVRPWAPGDRMRPAGLGGTKTLQDLFTDRKVPRAERRRLPVVWCAGEVAWIPGVAIAERFRATPASARTVRLAWHG
jgi:tRNA(Ile)-lysidine synthase